jgi:hypothetical protein
MQIVLFGLVFYRLVTTNHWTLGKKLLVALVGSILFQTVSLILLMVFMPSLILLNIILLPEMIVAGVMTYFFYKNEIEVSH